MFVWVNWGKGLGIFEGYVRGIKGVFEARYLLIGGEINVFKGLLYILVQMFCVFFYKNGVFKFEVGFLDSKEYCISVIGEVKRNVVK